MIEKILLIGLGSAGQRHARVLREMLPSASIFAYRGKHKRGLISLDLSVENLSIDPITHYQMTELISLNNCNLSFDLTVITTPISTHIEYLETIWDLSRRIIVEKPIVQTLQDASKIMRKLEQDSKPFLVGYQHNFNPIFTNILNSNLVQTDSWKYLEFWHEEPLSKMNPFRDMSNHHLAKKGQGGSLLALSHDLEFLLNLCGGKAMFLHVKLRTSISWAEVDDFIVLGGEVRLKDETVGKVRGTLSYAEKNIRRGGTIRNNSESITWDLNHKKLDVTGKPPLSFNYTSDNLIRLQLQDFLSKEKFDENLYVRFLRALKIIELESRGEISSTN